MEQIREAEEHEASLSNSEEMREREEVTRNEEQHLSILAEQTGESVRQEVRHR